MPTPQAAELVRGLGAWDTALLTIGSVLGTGIFLVSSDIAKALPHGGLLLLVWLVSGLLTLAGALSYAELGAMFPQAGGIYIYLREAYGPLPGFLYGWGCFLVIMSGGIAALAVGFGEYLGSFIPFFATSNVLLSASPFGLDWRLSGGQLAGALAILLLTAVNHFGLREGALVQNLLTALKIGAIVGFVVLGFVVAPKAPVELLAPLPGKGLLAGLAAGMIATLWTYDGWYGATFSAGETRDPGRNLPLGLVGGTLAITLLYAALNLVYLRALPIDAMAGASRVGEAAAAALFGPIGARLLCAAVVISTFGCISSTILYTSRIYLPMAEDGLFFRSLARVDPVRKVPTRSLWWQSLWAVGLTVSGSYSQLYTYVVFAAVLFHVATGAAVLVLRRTRPDLPRPYRVWGYPVVPLLFVLASLLLVGSTLLDSPKESIAGLFILALGLPCYAFWRRQSAAERRS